MVDYSPYPGGRHLIRGLPQLVPDAQVGDLSESAWLILHARDALQLLGIPICVPWAVALLDTNRGLQQALESRHGNLAQAHRTRRALQREMLSFTQAYAQVPP